jgi:hypothetical protein
VSEIHPLHRDPATEERRRIRAEDDQEEEDALQERLERAAEQASLPYSHPAIHRLARLERARRTGLTDGREAA